MDNSYWDEAYSKVIAHGVKRNTMEDKLLELKEQFCKWYCPKKDEELCFDCQLEEYIRFIRDDIDKI